MLTRTFLLLLPLFFTASLLSGQENPANAAPSREVRYKSPLDADIAKETYEVEHFAKNLGLLKSAFEKQDISGIVANERAILEAMRMETQQLEDKVAGDKIQAERRAKASAGEPLPGGAAQRPKRDPFAEAETTSEQRLETMRYTMLAFERHAFDPGKPEDAARDFAKLDAFLKVMQEELADLKK